MNPYAKRIAILIAELMVFLLVTVCTVYFFSYAGALQQFEQNVPPATFPVIAYDGDRSGPDSKNYFVMQWSEWEATAARRPGASLLLPETSRTFTIGEDKASFTATPEGESRQVIDLRWTGGGTERQARYLAQAKSIEPLYLRTVTSTTLLIGAAVGFVAGMLVGRTLRSRWLPQPGFYAPKG